MKSNSKFVVVGPRSVDHGENLKVFVIANIQNEAESTDNYDKITLKLEGERFGEIEEKEIYFNSSFIPVTFNVSDFVNI